MIRILILLFPYLLFSQIQIDKVQHFIAGGIIAGGTFVTINAITDKRGLSIAAGVLSSCAAGYVKEYYWDRKFGGTVSRADFLYTCAGGITVSFVIIIK